MAKEDQKTLERSKTIKWKHSINRSEKARENNKLYKVVD
jgi:hypothetical protein